MRCSRKTQNRRHFWSCAWFLRYKTVNCHRDRGGPGHETQNCCHFWTYNSFMALWSRSCPPLRICNSEITSPSFCAHPPRAGLFMHPRSLFFCVCFMCVFSRVSGTWWFLFSTPTLNEKQFFAGGGFSSYCGEPEPPQQKNTPELPQTKTAPGFRSKTTKRTRPLQHKKKTRPCRANPRKSGCGAGRPSIFA